MPTRPDPNSPFLASRLESEFGVRAPGTPTTAGMPTPQTTGVSFPAPPSANTAPAGRPPTTTGTPAAPGAAPALPPPPPQAGMVGPGTSAAPAPAPGSSTAAPAAATPVIGALPRQPSASELPVGAAIQTPMGTASRDAVTGEQSVALSPEGQQRYAAAVVAKREELGPVPSSMRHPTLPEMPVELGKWNFNPFTARWVK